MNITEGDYRMFEIYAGGLPRASHLRRGGGRGGRVSLRRLFQRLQDQY